ncbi:MAG: GH3 auxin-responsive promoter family protein, partial [Proteobacteria bacterium]|nr:GH3 auxin-responsive promoter family protein [Pseudomonadota bacterium]
MKSFRNTIKRILLKALYFRLLIKFKKASKSPEAQYEINWGRIKKLIARGNQKGQPVGRNLSDYPITTYEDYRSVIESSASINALTAENVTFWGVSTGTTGPQKRFPLSK